MKHLIKTSCYANKCQCGELVVVQKKRYFHGSFVTIPEMFGLMRKFVPKWFGKCICGVIFELQPEGVKKSKKKWYQFWK